MKQVQCLKHTSMQFSTKYDLMLHLCSLGKCGHTDNPLQSAFVNLMWL